MIDSDRIIERLRERVQEPADDYDHGVCGKCEAQLTQEDFDNGACTQCGDGVPEVDDESVDEHLYDDDNDGYYDGWETRD
jgi:hypothetical protein